MASGVITVGIDPMINLGPVTLSWHGLTIAAGVAIGGLFASIRSLFRRWGSS